MEELKVTFDDKVSIVTKPVPLINKVTDADMNQLKNKHNDTVDVLETIDGRLTTAEGDILTKQDDLGITDETTHLLTPKEIREGAGEETKLITSEEADNKIATEVPTQSDQFTTSEANITFLDTIYDSKTVTSVTFEKSAIFGEETLPIYNFLSISKTGAKHENKCLVIHSSLIVPEILVANKPTSPLPTYADQATMTADFAAQSEGEYYYYTGSTSAWLYDGTATDSIDNYTELEAIAGWEEWGTRPTWLKVTGSYLVGSSNINYLHFQYFKSKSGNTTDFDFVECNVVSLENGNLDANLIQLHKIVENQFNEGTIIGDDTIINDSIYAENIMVLLRNLNPANPLNVASYTDLGGGNFALSTITNSDTISGFSNFTTKYIPNTGFLLNRLISSQKLTAFFRINFPNLGQTSSVIVVAQNQSALSPTSGFRIRLRTDFRIEISIWRSNGTVRNYSSDVLFPIALDDNYQSFCVQLYRNESDQFKVDVWLLSQDRSYAFTKVIDSTDTNTDIFLNTQDDIQFEGDTATAVRARRVDQQYIYVGKIFSESEVQTILNQMEGI
jgi:hypothetical protein